MKDMGTLKARLSGDSLRPFEDCWLCLRPARSPVCTPRGYVYCRECIVMNLARQKDELNRNLRLWEEYEIEQAKEKSDEKAREHMEIAAQFAERDENPVRRVNSKNANSRNSSSSSNQGQPPVPAALQSQPLTSGSKRRFAEIDKSEARAKSFWAVENTPTLVLPTKIQKPSMKLMCPISNTPLRVKELIVLKPLLNTLSNSSEGGTGTVNGIEECKWLCAVCSKVMSHQKAVLIPFSGDIMCLQDCFENSVEGKSGYYGSRRITKDDVVPLIAGGTGFSAHNKVEAQRYRATMQL